MTLDAIKEAIEQLAPEEQTVLASWLSERDWKASRRAAGECHCWPNWSGKLRRARLDRWKKAALSGLDRVRKFSVLNVRSVLATVR